jgi:acyl-CoA synthetase (AMP-forming)/AMP-acid ligase II
MPRGEPGEIHVQGPHNMKEYWNRPDATAETVVDGWLHTGDVAVMDEDGFVTIQDRMKDMIISGGENVYPAEVENVLLSHPAIADAAVIGQESAKWGESPLAIIVRKDTALTEAEVLEHCQAKLARFKLPKQAVFVDEIPRNPSGKVLKRVLREQYPGPAAE